MRMSDATPPGPQTSACSTSLPRFSPAKSLRSASERSKPGDDELLGDDPANIIDALKAAILAGAAPSDLGRSLTYGAALRVARFGNANEHADCETAHHVFTYANALDQLIKRIGSDSDSDITGCPWGPAWSDGPLPYTLSQCAACPQRMLNYHGTLVRKRNDRSTRSTICAAAWIVSGCCVKPGRGDIYPAISRATSS